MFKGVTAYLYQGNTVVLNKEDIKNAKEEDFLKVFLYLPHNFIKESAEELKYLDLANEEIINKTEDDVENDYL